MDELCEQYNAVCAEIKELTAKKDELKAQLMSCDGESSDSWSITVKESKSDRIESLKAIKDKSQSLFDALHSAGCVKQVTSTRLYIKPIE